MIAIRWCSSKKEWYILQCLKNVKAERSIAAPVNESVLEDSEIQYMHTHATVYTFQSILSVYCFDTIHNPFVNPFRGLTFSETDIHCTFYLQRGQVIRKVLTIKGNRSYIHKSTRYILSNTAISVITLIRSEDHCLTHNTSKAT